MTTISYIWILKSRDEVSTEQDSLWLKLFLIIIFETLLHLEWFPRTTVGSRVIKGEIIGTIRSLPRAQYER